MKKSEPKKVQPKPLKPSELDVNVDKPEKALTFANLRIGELLHANGALIEEIRELKNPPRDATISILTKEIIELRARVLAYEIADDSELAALENASVALNAATHPQLSSEVVFHRGPQGPEAYCTDPLHPRLGWRHERGGPEYCVKCGWVVQP